MKSRSYGVLASAAAAAALLTLAGCGQYGYPTLADAVCGVSGFDCRPECRAVTMPAPGTDPNALSYQIGPCSCPPRTVSEARRDAAQACRDRGLSLAPAAPELTEQPPVGPLSATQAATFHCQG